MPDINKYDDKKEWMSDCMHQTVTVEKKKRDQGVAQCLNMWKRKKKMAMEIVSQYRRAQNG
jgi:hypothetical protein